MVRGSECEGGGQDDTTWSDTEISLDVNGKTRTGIVISLLFQRELLILLYTSTDLSHSPLNPLDPAHTLSSVVADVSLQRVFFFFNNLLALKELRISTFGMGYTMILL